MYGWREKRMRKRIGVLLLSAGCLFFFMLFVDLPKEMLKLQMPILFYNSQKPKQLREIFVDNSLVITLPIMYYIEKNELEDAGKFEEENLWASLLAERESEEKKQMEELEKENSAASYAITESEKDIRLKMEEENAKIRDNISENTISANEFAQVPIGDKDVEKQGDEADAFQKRENIVCPVDVMACQNYETMMKTFYVIDSNTYVEPKELAIGSLLGTDLTIQKMDNEDTLQQVDFSNTSNPQILIYHTHSQEGYADSVIGDDTTTVMGAGEELARILETEYGFRVLHHTGKYDVKNRDYAYSEALPGIEKVLADNPSIEVVIDLHRDGVADGTRLVTQLDGKNTAQVMLFNGMSRTKKIGEIEYLKNDNRQSNLAFSFQLQKNMEEYYPGFARKIYLKGYRYNMHFKPRTLLIELGAQTNTREEVWNALPPLAHCIAMTLEGEEQQDNQMNTTD